VFQSPFSRLKNEIIESALQNFDNPYAVVSRPVTGKNHGQTFIIRCHDTQKTESDSYGPH
jgi:hypothetical protein